MNAPHPCSACKAAARTLHAIGWWAHVFSVCHYLCCLGSVATVTVVRTKTHHEPTASFWCLVISKWSFVTCFGLKKRFFFARNHLLQLPVSPQLLCFILLSNFPFIQPPPFFSMIARSLPLKVFPAKLTIQTRISKWCHSQQRVEITLSKGFEITLSKG